ncbi:MAG: hypothetical protein ACT4NY_30260 [Pseudonocardiales bacterium]
MGSLCPERVRRDLGQVWVFSGHCGIFLVPGRCPLIAVSAEEGAHRAVFFRQGDQGLGWWLVAPGTAVTGSGEWEACACPVSSPVDAA